MTYLIWHSGDIHPQTELSVDNIFMMERRLFNGITGRLYEESKSLSLSWETLICMEESILFKW